MSGIDSDARNRRLLEVQVIDTRIFDLKNQIINLAGKHGLDELEREAESVGESLQSRKNALEALEHRQHKLDGELDLLTLKIKKEKEKLFSGTIMNPKELNGINEEIQSLEKRRDEMETEDLELMDASDLAGEEVKTAGSEFKEIAGRQDEAKGAYTAELADLEKQISVLEEERDALKGELDSETVELYEKLLRQKGGLAVVKIEHGRNCGGCHIEFSISQVDRFQHEEGFFRCEFCQRILVK
ncbi:MAG: hypothetical protein JXA49_01105 [Actinobacteria bacterium]|nr:hypothetical protein [Actinomycetota bacterium]